MVRSTRVAAAEVPSVPDDQVTLPVPWDPTIIHILGAVINADHPHDRMGALPHQVDAADLWCASNTSMTPVTGQILLAGRGYRTLV